MQSQIESALKMKFNPVAIIWSDKLPADAMRFKEGRWGCLQMLLKEGLLSLTKKPMAVGGGGVGLGFGNTYKYFPGGKRVLKIFFKR